MPKATATVKSEKISHQIAEVPAQKPWSYQLAFWGVGLLLFLSPYFRGLFFATEQQRVLILAALLFWCVWLWKHSRREYSFLSHPLDYFILALPVVYIIASFNAANYGLAVDEIVKNILYFLIYWAVVQLIKEETDLSRLLHIIYFAAAGVALAGLATATGIIDIKDGFLNGRIYSSFQYPNALASFLALAGFLGLFFWQKNAQLSVAATITDKALLKLLPERLLKLKPYGYLYIAVNFIIMAVLFGTKSRGGLLITGVVFVIYLIGLYWQKRLPVLIHTLFVGGLGYLLIHQFIPAAVAKHMGVAWLWILLGLMIVLSFQGLYNFLEKRKILSIKQDNINKIMAGLGCVIVVAGGIFSVLYPELLKKVFSFIYLRNAFERFYFIKDALAMLKERPVLGWGGGGWEEAYRSFQGYLYNSNEVHSYYFQVAVEAGILGLLMVLGIWVTFLWTGYKAYRTAIPEGEKKFLVWTLLAAAVAVGVHAAIDFDLSLSALTIALWTVFGCTRAVSNLSEAKKQDLIGDKQSISKKEKRRKQYKNLKKEKHRINIPPSRPLLLAGYSTISIIIFLFGLTLASANTYARNASSSLQSGNAQEGISYMKKATLYNPFNAEYHAGLMHIYLASGEIEQGLKEARRAAVLSRYSAARKADLASAYLAAGKYKEAIDHARRAVQLAPYQIVWYENLANVCAVAGRGEIIAGNKDTARQYLEEALKVPELIQDKVAGLGKEEKRLWNVAPMLASTPRVHLYTGQSRYLLGQWEEAEEDLQSAANDEQIKGEALVWLALVKEEQGKEKEAKELVKQASDIDKAYNNAFERLKRLQTLNS